MGTWTRSTNQIASVKIIVKKFGNLKRKFFSGVLQENSNRIRVRLTSKYLCDMSLCDADRESIHRLSSKIVGYTFGIVKYYSDICYNQLKPQTMKVINYVSKWMTGEKMGFVNRMETLPKGMDKFIQIRKCGISKRTYNRWLKRYGVSSIYSPVIDGIKNVNPEVVSMFKVHPKIEERMTKRLKEGLKGKKFLYNVSLSIEVGSLDELTEIVTNLQNVPSVHNINSVTGN